MSSIRSNGIAEIVKMGGQKTQARTRLIWILNPVDGRPIRKMPNGAMDGIHDFLQNPEDIARFDLAMSAASEDVPPEFLSRERERSVHHAHTSDDCKLLVTWAWSRKVDQITFRPGVEEYIYEKAQKVSSRYVVDIPLIQQQNFHVKLARISVAVAMRVFSTDKSGELVRVGKEHVDTAVKILDGLYGKPSFGYRKYSKKKIADEKFAESMKEDAHLWLLGEPGSLNTLISVKNSITFKNRDFEDSGGMTRFEASEAVQKLVSMGMLENAGKGNWTMKPALHDVVRELEELRRLERLERI